jgi:hypothetical protein
MGLSWIIPRKLHGFGQVPFGQTPFGGGAAPPAPTDFVPGLPATLPIDTNLEWNDLPLRHLLQQLVSGIAGLAGNLVYPRWQPEPVNQPDFGVDWASVGVVGRTRDVFATVIHTTYPPDPLNPDVPVQVTDTVNRNEILSVLCSFYGPHSEQFCETLAMGLMLEQNRYVMQLNGLALVDVGETLTVPYLKKGRWLMGQDVSFRARRQQNYTYPSGNIETVQASVITEAQTLPILVSDSEENQ